MGSTAKNIVRKWWRLANDNLERIAYIVAITGFPLLLVSTILVYNQLVDVRRIAASQNNIQLSILFLRNNNIAIIKAIERNVDDHKTQILRANGGSFDTTQLDNYLGDFETIDQVYREGLLTEDEMCVSFSYYVGITAKNQEIKKYLADNADFFGGVVDLATAVARSKDQNCR
jgi:hypothetical protein